MQTPPEDKDLVHVSTATAKDNQVTSPEGTIKRLRYNIKKEEECNGANTMQSVQITQARGGCSYG
ncbi:hypothetical protein Krac_6383 [Ktedonobacter racemifer DSM 44963]|uniref:Uncharacterized protein n=1 Tax=Ktedonobacter racemifer DSM 44963 TaxID=485913 RepID=D6TUB1_KTERA|nr:hypothetical protein Krac_6383 [Ktedonobacter racemifer DSM 44963]